jgi:hypothetical protein
MGLHGLLQGQLYLFYLSVHKNVDSDIHVTTFRSDRRFGLVDISLKVVEREYNSRQLHTSSARFDPK